MPVEYVQGPLKPRDAGTTVGDTGASSGSSLGGLVQSGSSYVHREPHIRMYIYVHLQTP